MQPKVKPNARLVQYWTQLGERWEQSGNKMSASDYYRKAYRASEAVHGARHRITQDLRQRLGLK